MGEFFQAAFAFPTVVFTALMALVLAYWLVFMMGMADMDVLGSGDALGGAGEEVADAAIEALAGDGADAAVDALDGGDGGWLGSLTQVPITLTLSILIFVSWTISLFGVRLLRRFGIVPEGADGPGATVAAIVIAVAFLGGGGATIAAIRPLRPMFARPKARSRASFVGSECTVFSGKVDASFGVAEIEDGGPGLRVDVRCPEANELRRGDQARVVSYDTDDDVFLVKPLQASDSWASESSSTNK